MYIITIAILLSIVYLFLLSQYNLCSFNSISTSSNWFIHPSNGGVCIFGQIMVFLTCILLIVIVGIVMYSNILYDSIRIILVVLSFMWVAGSYFMNNNWLGERCIPVAILWSGIALMK
jgi:hypothetical protein